MSDVSKDSRAKRIVFRRRVLGMVMLILLLPLVVTISALTMDMPSSTSRALILGALGGLYGGVMWSLLLSRP